MKYCSKCKEKKSYLFYSKDSKSKDGYQSWCKSCKAEQLSEYYKKNPNKRGNYYSKEKSLRAYYRNRVHSNVARMVRRGLMEHKKGRPTFKLLGYTQEDLKRHLENLFTEGMSWDNYGEWHIDHIIPRAKLPFETETDENFKKCWSLDNLQPLWARDNRMKSDKI